MLSSVSKRAVSALVCRENGPALASRILYTFLELFLIF